jgi:hypothetical protein
MDSFFSSLNLSYLELKKCLSREPLHIASAFAMPIKRNGEIDLSKNTNNNTTDLSTLLFNSYNDSSINNNEKNK